MLADLLPVILATRMQPQRIGRAASQRRWQQKNRKHLRAYKRAWRAARAV